MIKVERKSTKINLGIFLAVMVLLSGCGKKVSDEDGSDSATRDLMNTPLKITMDDGSSCRPVLDDSDQPTSLEVHGLSVRSFEYVYAFLSGGIGVGFYAYEVENCGGDPVLLQMSETEVEPTDETTTVITKFTTPTLTATISEINLEGQDINYRVLASVGDYEESNPGNESVFLVFYKVDGGFRMHFMINSGETTWEQLVASEGMGEFDTNPTCEGVDPKDCSFTLLKF